MRIMKENIKEVLRTTIVGNGDIAKAIMGAPHEALHPDWIYYASGVSNSAETRESEFIRERDLILSQDKTKHIIYISSLCIYYKETPYANHKRNMEKLIKDNFPAYTILRLGNITWGDNPTTIINFFKNELKAGRPLSIQDVDRFIVEKDELYFWFNLIPEWPCEMNIPGRRMKVVDVVNEFVYGNKK
jgi:hypothetical protein